MATIMTLLRLGHWRLRHSNLKPWPAGTSAQGIHFEEEPTLQGPTCPDGSHLDTASSRRFTDALMAILRSHGITF